MNTKMLLISLGPIGIEVEDADDLFFLAADNSVAEATGKYFVNQKTRQAPLVSSRAISLAHVCSNVFINYHGLLVQIQ